MKSKKFQILIHIAGGIAFLSLPVIFSPDYDQAWRLFFINPFRRDFFAYILLLGFFYLNFYVLVPRLFFRKKYFSYIASLILLYVVLTLLPLAVFGSPRKPSEHFRDKPPTEIRWEQKDAPVGYPRTGRNPGFPLHFRLGQHFFQFLIVFFFSLMLRLNQLLKRTEKEKALAELSFLKAQINPHFLFNTLNSIYALTLDKSDAAPTAVIKLSGIMRYIINEATTEYVPLDREIDYIRDYVDLQKFRFEDTVKLSFNVTGDTSELYIAPLLLIPFIENAFKYGVNPEAESVVDIHIRVENSILFFKTYNQKNVLPPSTPQQSRIGMHNTVKRLENIYGSKYELKINENVHSYTAELKINLL